MRAKAVHVQRNRLVHQPADLVCRVAGGDAAGEVRGVGGEGIALAFNHHQVGTHRLGSSSPACFQSVGPVRSYAFPMPRSAATPRSDGAAGDAALQLRVYILGDVRVEGLDRFALGSRKGRLLLRELALARGRAISPDALAETLWGDDLPKDPAAQVAVIVSRLRRVLGGDRIPLGDTGYALRYDWLDIEDAEHLVDDAERRLSVRRQAAALAAARGALALLENAPTDDGRHDPLAVRLTARARHVCVRALLMGGDLAAAIETAQQCIDADPYDEEGLRLAMSGMAAAGQSSAALALYERFRAQLADELGAAPSPATEFMHRSVLRDEPVPSVDIALRRVAPDVATGDSDGLVGRAHELAELNEAWRVTRERGLTRLAVDGEPGIGKTFLVRTWLARLGTKTTVLSARAGEIAPSLPLQPILDALQEHLRTAGRQSPQLLLGAERVVLAPLLGRPAAVESRDYEAALSLATSPAATAILHSALISVMRRVCAQPSVLLIDDAHRADPATIAWLLQITQRAPDLPLLVITIQPGRQHRATAVDRVITVGPLSVEAAAKIVGRDRAAALHRRTGGNPLFLTELAKAPEDVAIPDSVQTSIASRCDSLGAAGDTLRAAALLGGEVDIELLAGVLHADPITLIDHLEMGASSALVAEDHATFVFPHEIVRDALAAGVGSARRALLHREAARLLSEAPDADPLVVAEHARLGGEGHIASVALTRASAMAAERFDHADALQRIDEALSFETTTAALLQRARIHLAQARYRDAEADAATALERGDDPRALEVAAAVAYYRRHFERAQSLAGTLRERTADPRLQLEGLTIGARAAHAAGDLTAALELFGEAMQLAQRTGLRVPASPYAFLQVHRGELDAALRLLEVSVWGLATRMPSSTAYTAVHDQFISGYALATAGRITEAQERWNRGATEVARQGLTRYAGMAPNLNAWALRGVGELNAAREGNAEARAAGRDADYRELEVYAVLDLCEIEMLDGNQREAHTLVDAAIALTRDDFAYRWRHLLRVDLLRARLMVCEGDPAGGRDMAIDVMQRARQHHAQRYVLLAALLETEARARAGGVIDAAALLTLCEQLPSLAGPEAWRLTADAGAVTGVVACRGLAERQAAQLAASLPEVMTGALRRYAGARLVRMSTSAASG